MKPTQKPCKTCKYYDANAYWCSVLDEYGTQPWWKGCVMHKEKEK